MKMNSEKNLTGTEELDALAEEITAICAQRSFNAGVERLQMYHEVGQAILGNPLYAKNKHGQGALLQRLQTSTGMGERTLRYCVEFGEKYKTFEDVMSLADGEHKLPAWRSIVRNELPSGKRDEVETNECAHEWLCQKCGAYKQ